MEECSACGDNRVGFIGNLGRMAWFECRACGMKYGREGHEGIDIESDGREEFTAYLNKERGRANAKRKG